MKRWLALLALVGTCYGQIENPPAREDLGFSTNLNTLWTSTNASNARSAIGLSVSNSVEFNEMTSTRYSFTPSADATEGGAYLERLDADAYQTDYDGLGIYDNNGNILAYFFQGDISFNSPLTFQTNIVAQTRTNLGLGGGITTNISFVDALTNTNSVTISNGIITGWTQ